MDSNSPLKVHLQTVLATKGMSADSNSSLQRQKYLLKGLQQTVITMYRYIYDSTDYYCPRTQLPTPITVRGHTFMKALYIFGKSNWDVQGALNGFYVNREVSL